MYARAVVVRTSLSLAEARALATCWGLAVDGIAAIDAGTLNSSYVLASAGRRFFLRICERAEPREAEAEVRLLARLAADGVPVAAPLMRVDCPESWAARWAGKPAFVLRWIDGASLRAREVQPAHAWRVGVALAKVHRASVAVTDVPATKFGIARLAALVAGIDVAGRGADLCAAIGRLRRQIDEQTAQPLPIRGLIHGDLFRENVLWSGPNLAAVLDFEAACAGNFAFDLMIAALAWCYGTCFDVPRLRALVDGYRTIRTLDPAEIDELHRAARAAAVRFAVTRLADYELGPEQPPARDFRRMLARLDAIETLGPDRWRAALGL